MERLRKTYLVAGHQFSFAIEGNSPLWRYIFRAYNPFEWDNSNDDLFTISLEEDVSAEDVKQVYVDENPEPGYVKIAVYRYSGGYYMEFTQYDSDIINGKMTLDEGGDVRVSLYGDEMHQWMTFTNVTQVVYFIRTSTLDTVMAHASAIHYRDRAYLFLGKSGTGKSTHSRMWLEGVDGAELMNDDHPIIRIGEDGIPVAYGSPWSGKTHCYRNIAAPVGAIVRIRQEKENVIRRLRPIEAYGSVMASCSGFPIEERFTEGKSNTLQKIIKGAPCWELGCLPDVDAALVCSEAVVNN